MSYDDFLQLTNEDGVAWLTLNRPQKHNAMNAEMIAGLTCMAQELGDRDDVHAVVLTGKGASFCAGGDLQWMRVQMQSDRETRMCEARKLAMMFKALNCLPKPLIACVQGNAHGGGIGLLCTCDVVIAAHDVFFAFSEAKLGLTPATIAPYVVARIGTSQARQVMLSAERFSAKRALAMGLVNHVVEGSDLVAFTTAQTACYADLSAPAIADCKSLLQSLGQKIDAAVIEDTVNRLADGWELPSTQARIRKFLKL